MTNLLTEPLIHTNPLGFLTLPGLLAAMSRDEVENFPSLRPHQGPAWHMFLVQLAALALHGAGIEEIPDTESAWLAALRGLTSHYLGDEPWRLVVDDWSQPAFLQPPAPPDLELKSPVPTPDALDLLITSRNHDLKQSVMRQAEPQDWIFALVSLQTSEGFGGRGNYGIARMNGGSSSRPLLGLAPLLKSTGLRAMAVSPGAWFRRDLTVLLQRRAHEVKECCRYPDKGGIGLTWLATWPEDEQLQVWDLDIWFIEICRRIRLGFHKGELTAWKGNSSKERIAAKQFNGSLTDPWAPVHKSENKCLTLGEGEFDYRKLCNLLFSGDWILPLLARPASFETEHSTLAIMAAALSRGNSKTEGFKTRCLPIGGRIAYALMRRRKELHELAVAQMAEIEAFDKAISGALALVAAGGDWEKRKKEHYTHAKSARIRFNRAADDLFFPSLWARFTAHEHGKEACEVEEKRFARALYEKAGAIFANALPAVPCTAIFRPRAEARAHRAFQGAVRKQYPELFVQQIKEDIAHEPV